MMKRRHFLLRLAMILSVCILMAATSLADRDAGPSSGAVVVTQVQKDSPSLFTRIKTAAAEGLARLGIDTEAAKLYAKWVVGAPTLVIAILLAMLLRPGKKSPEPPVVRQPRRVRPSAVPRPRRASPTGSTSKPVFSKTRQVPEPKTDKERVLHFFFRLFKQQLGAPADAPFEVKLVETRPTCPNETYEMRVQMGDEWSFRRMSIGLLGQGGGSRSMCYYVIYDSHLVLKIPSEPIPDFTTYHRRIAAEAEIVSRLAPRECIVPRVAVIMKAVHTLPDGKELSEEAQEGHYVVLLKADADYQEYLKIGSSFVFFMDLARHFFLSTVLEEIHRGEQRNVNEAMKQQELLWDQHGFVCRYGEDAGLVCHDLQEAYYRCESRLRRLVQEAEVQEEVSAFQFKQWYLTHLAGENIDPGGLDLPEELVERVNRLLARVVGENQSQVDQYRESVHHYIRETRFSQRLSQVESISDNILDLLAWMGRKHMAMRDLKPENLFVAGDPNSYPLFLNDTTAFSIGLIDVETAVLVDDDPSAAVPQPQLAGTPLYATPTHLLSNTILEEIYGDVPKILYLQDWYAAIAILYKVVTGANLFPATARVFPAILKKIKLLDPTGALLNKEVADISRTFWKSAIAEFQEAMDNNLDTFSRVEVAVPEALLPKIVKALHSECDHLGSVLAETVSRQSVFTDRQKCQYLLDVPVEKISRMKSKLLREAPGKGWRSQRRVQALEVLDRVERLKARMQRKLEAAAALKATGGAIGADQLLEAMFEWVFSAMYPPNWPDPKPAKWTGSSDLPEDITTYQATM